MIGFSLRFSLRLVLRSCTFQRQNVQLINKNDEILVKKNECLHAEDVINVGAEVREGKLQVNIYSFICQMCISFLLEKIL